MKERLTGAIILVALLVLLVPELLTGPSRSAPSAQAPANSDAAQMRSYTIDLGDDANAHRSGTEPEEVPGPHASTAATPGNSEVQAGNGSPEDGTQLSSARTENGAQTSDSRSTESASSRPATGPANVSESNPAAQAAGAEVANSAAPTSRTQPPKPSAQVESPAVSATAPKPQTSAARVEPPPVARGESAAPDVESGSRFGSATPPRAPSAATHVTSGWAIQVGSFASRDNAERLARELKGKGFAATVSQSTKGKQLWRVRVGPEADRAAAVALGARLRAVGQPGAVVTYP